MIIKGGSRAGPRQLATHLLRTDTNERVLMLELQSGLANLEATFRDWQTLSEGTKGKLGLYHVNIDPDARYTMTEAQWARCVDVLEKELGLVGQPRAVVMHEKHGREHIHVVWARTDLDTMTLRSDSYNYLAHERASLMLEREFGHEHVPGKHAKRDREKQPEFPRAEINHAEWQQAERAALEDPVMAIEDRRAQLAALHSASDNGQAFKAAVEEAGYILAKGDRRDFVLVDAHRTYSLGRELKLKAAEVRQFMADVDRDQLPTEGDARAQMSARRTAAAEVAPATPDSAGQTEQAPRTLDPVVAAALAERQAIERQKWQDWHAKELADLDFKLSLEIRDQLAGIDAAHSTAREDLARTHAEAAANIWERLQRIINPAVVAERAQERRDAAEALWRRHLKEREDLLALALQSKELEKEALAAQHAQKMREVELAFAQEEQRYLADQERVEALLAELETQREADEMAVEEQRADDEDYQEEERLQRENREPWSDDPLRRGK